MKRRRFAIAIMAAMLSVAATCGPTSVTISRERAIEIARSQVSFTPDSTDAELTTASGVRVWRVTFRGRLPGQPPGLFETAIVDVDARSGTVVSLART